MKEIFRDLCPGQDDEAIAALWKRNFGSPVGGQTAEWLFRPGPLGECPRAVAEVDGRIVAHAGAAAMRFRLDGEDVPGGYSIGAMTDPEMRGRGLYVRVSRYLYERMERQGFAFVAGFSNANSHRIMTGPLGRTAIRPFPWCVRLLRPLSLGGVLLRRLRGSPPDSRPAAVLPPQPVESDGVRVTPCAPGNPRLDVLWNRTAGSVRVGGVRDADFSLWRFGNRPDAGYHMLIAERGGEPAACAVYRVLTLHGLRGGFIVDLLVAPGEQGAGRALLQATAGFARSHGAQVLSVLLPGEGAAHDALRAEAFRRVPERLHPQLIRFSVRGLGRFADCATLTDPTAWLLSWADTDVV